MKAKKKIILQIGKNLCSLALVLIMMICIIPQMTVKADNVGTTVHHHMKVSQCGKFQELLKFLQVQLQKPSSAIMKLVLMTTATGKEDPELTLCRG